MRSPDDERMRRARHNGDRKPEDIESEIASTRAEMSDTLDAIQRKLSPGQILDQALSCVRSGSGEFASNFAGTIKQNPVPITLLGISLGWLMLSGRSSGGRYYSGDVAGEYYAPEAEGYMPEESMGSKMRGAMQSAREKMSAALGKAGEAASSAQERAGEMAQGAHDTAGHVSESMRDTASSMRDSAGHMAGSMREKSSQIAGRVRDRTSRLAGGARHSAQRARSGFEHMLNEQPLLLGALGVAIGAAIGAALPSTRRESELMGQTRDDLLQRAREVGEEQLHKAGRVAEAAGEAAKEEAGRQGMSP